VPTDKDRDMVRVMVAGGILQTDIGKVLGISHVTLRKHFRREIDVGAAEIAGRMVQSLVTMALGTETEQPNFNAIKWYTQAKMGWSEKVVVEDNRPQNQPMKVQIELMGQPAPVAVQVERPTPRVDPRLLDAVEWRGSRQ
jgi:hypothetical protein